MNCLNFIYLRDLSNYQLFDLFIKSNSKIVVFNKSNDNIIFKDKFCYINYSSISKQEDIVILALKAFILDVLLKNNLEYKFQDCYLYFQNKLFLQKRIESKSNIDSLLNKFDLILYKTYKDNFI